MELYTFLGLIHSDSLQLTRNYAVCGVSAIKCPFHNTKSAARACKVPKKREKSNSIPCAAQLYKFPSVYYMIDCPVDLET